MVLISPINKLDVVQRSRLIGQRTVHTDTQRPYAATPFLMVRSTITLFNDASVIQYYLRGDTNVRSTLYTSADKYNAVSKS